jgi:hypothetical protein
MRLPSGRWIALVACAVGISGRSSAAGIGDLTVHLVQANNDSPYALVRAKFEPGQVTDPWAVRFFAQDGVEVPYFVWDSVTWRVAEQGRGPLGGSLLRPRRRRGSLLRMGLGHMAGGGAGEG